MKVVSGNYDPVAIEEKISSWWKDNDVFRTVVKMRKGASLFRFLEGPPTANGFMHVGHARGRTMKDVVLRFKTMQGYDVWRQAGWDCQGLPVELEVEKKLGITSKKEIEQTIGLPEFIRHCNELVDFYLDHWRKASERLGLWLDYENAYETRDDRYIESVWWILKRADLRGLLVDDLKVVPTCPRCETPLSSHEVAQGYASVKDPSIYVKFSLEGKENEFVVIWTTTPWTLPGDEVVCVHPDFSYARVRVGGEVWIMAEGLVEKVMDELGISKFEILEVVPGRDLEGTKYRHPLLEEVPIHRGHHGKYEHSIVLGEHVTLEEGTGCVHTAPAHGPEDFEVSKRYGISIFSPVDVRGLFTQEGGRYSGKYVKKADPIILEDLKRRGLLLKASTIEHEYPLCWRCDAPLIYRVDKQWFIRIDPIRESIVEENEAVNWVPEWAGSSRFKDWLLNADDWCISRSRIWGSPLNVWVCEGCGDKHVVGTVEELKAMARSLPEKLELHRPWVDQVILACPHCGGDMRRVEYVLDCWLDSGAAHTAAIASQSDRTLINRLYPYDYITEAVDQTRGWFYSLIFTGVATYSKSPYRNVLCQGHILDKYGQKMSKSRGNVVWALDAMQRVGTDPLRIYMLWKAQPWDSLAFDPDEIDQVKRWLSILWNVFAFATMYMVMDGFEPARWGPTSLKGHLRAEDRWLLSRTQTLIEEVTKNTEALQLHYPIRSLINFITEDLSRFYIRLIRRRTWVEKEDPDKLAAYATLYKTLTTVLKLLAPFAPYITEELYQQLTDGEPDALESVHMCEWPVPQVEWVDKELEDQMEVVDSLITASLNARQQARLKLRWPIRVLYVAPANDVAAMAVRDQERVLLDQVNTKRLEVLRMGCTPEGVRIVAEIDYTKGGPVFKDTLPEVAVVLRAADGGMVRRRLSEKGRLSLELRDGTPVDLTPDLLTFREELPNNLIAADSPYGRIYVDIIRTPELDAEALAREVTRRAQVMRKEMDLRVEEYVDLVIQAQDEEAVEFLNSMGDYITTEVRARKLSILKPGQPFKPAAGAYVKEWDIDGEEIKIAIKRLSASDR